MNGVLCANNEKTKVVLVVNGMRKVKNVNN